MILEQASNDSKKCLAVSTMLVPSLKGVAVIVLTSKIKTMIVEVSDSYCRLYLYISVILRYAF